MAFILGRINKGIGAGIGLAFEAHAHHKEKKALQEASQGITPSVSQTPSRSASDAVTPVASSENSKPLTDEEYAASAEERERRHAEGDGISDFEDDEQDWALDDAAEDLDSPVHSPELESPPPYREQDGKTISETIGTFVADHPQRSSTPGGTNTHRTPLPCPVIIPQRRPRRKARGFIRAYAPVLEDSGIDQRTFIDFIEALDTNSRASGVLTAINVAAMGAGFVPEPITQAVATGVQVVVGVASEVQRRYRGNEFLSAINRELFMPKGLFVMILTFKPSSSEKVIDVNLKSTGDLVTKQLSNPESSARRTLKKLAISTDKVRGEVAIPDCAPLIFPSIDRAAAAVATGGGDAITEKQKSKLGRTGGFIGDYMDRRARATYNFQNPNSKLGVPDDKKWASRYSDPNHPANSGHLVSLLTGGVINPKQRRRPKGPIGLVMKPVVKMVGEKMQERRAAKETGANSTSIGRVEGSAVRPAANVRPGFEGRSDSGDLADSLKERTNAASPFYRNDKNTVEDNPYGEYGRYRRAHQKPRGLIARILTEDVLYLMVCNLPEGFVMPQEGELAAETVQSSAAAQQ